MFKSTSLGFVLSALALTQEVPTITAVLNGASFDRRLAPGVQARVLGTALGPETPVQHDFARDGGALLGELAGVAVMVNGRRSALFRVSSTQIDMQIPVELQDGSAVVEIQRKVGDQVLRSSPYPVILDKYAPAIGALFPPVPPFLTSDSLPIGLCNPARPDDTLQVIAVGLGPTNPPIPTGAMAPGSPRANTIASPSLRVGGKVVPAMHSFLAMGFAGGLYLVMFSLPKDTASGQHPVFLEIEGRTSQSGVVLPVGPKPGLLVSAVVNAASAAPAISWGSWMSIYGCNLAATTRIWRPYEIANGKLPIELDGVSVKVNGKDAAVYYISPTQINAQVPDGTTEGTVPVEVRNLAGRVATTAIVRTFSPAFFVFEQENARYVAAVHSNDGVYVGPTRLFGGRAPARPAKPGDIILLFGTGFGPTTPPVPAGVAFLGAAPLAETSVLTVKIGGVPAHVQFAGIASAGLYQFNVVVPSIPDGDHLVSAVVNGFSTQTDKYIYVQR